MRPVVAATGQIETMISIWDRVDPTARGGVAVHALCGIPQEAMAELAVLVAAASAEAEVLLQTTPQLLRVLSSSTSMAAERCVGHVQGPVLWSETLNARAHTLGGDDVFVCGVMQRDFDTPENEVLLSALDLLGRAGALLEHVAADYVDDETHELIAARSAVARSLRAERALDGVRRNRAGNMQVHRVRMGRHSKRYEPALSVLRRRSEPFRAADLAVVSDARTIGQLRGLALMCDALERRGVVLEHLRVSGPEVAIGPIRFRNWRHATGQGNFGVLVGPVLIDTPTTDDADERANVLNDLEARAGRRAFCLVATPDEADIAVDLALDAHG